MKKLLDSDWLRTVQFFLNTVQLNAKKGNKASILIGQWTKKFTDSQSNLLFSNQARALDGAIMAQLWRNFFVDCVIIKITWGAARAQKLRREFRVRKVCKIQNILPAIFFMYIITQAVRPGFSFRLSFFFFFPRSVTNRCLASRAHASLVQRTARIFYRSCRRVKS